MEEQILIFRTSVRNARDIKHIAALFTLCPQIYKWNVDMEDWEKVLRIECQGITPTEISKALRAINIYAQELSIIICSTSKTTLFIKSGFILFYIKQ